MSIRTLSPAVTITNLPGTDCALFGAKRFAEPISIMLFRFLNLSPPCAASAARASSSGVLFAVIAGAAAIALDAGVEALLLDFAASGPWAIAAAQSRIRNTGIGRYLFIKDSSKKYRREG